MKKKFNCNKIIDSNSVFVKHLKEYIIDTVKISNNVKIDVDKEDFGEADYKILNIYHQIN